MNKTSKRKALTAAPIDIAHIASELERISRLPAIPGEINSDERIGRALRIRLPSILYQLRALDWIALQKEIYDYE